MKLDGLLLDAARVTAGRPAGERHLFARLERGAHGLSVATAAIVELEAGGELGLREVDSFPFEERQTAREWLSAWVWYRIGRHKEPHHAP